MFFRVIGQRCALAAVVFVAVALASGTAPAWAETLFDALADAYTGNPSLRAERARQRATDEQVPQALSGWRPQVFARGEAGMVFERLIDSSEGAQGQGPKHTNPGAVAITLTQPIFRGFKTLQQRNQAEATVKAGRQNLLAVEQQVLFQAVQAYMNVLRDRQILVLRRENVVVLREQYRAAQTRFEVGEVTRTDVAQAEARLSFAISTVASAKANLTASVATFERVIGHVPGTLKYPSLAKRPKTLEAAFALAQKINPNILSAAFVAEAARYAIEVQKGDLLPEVSVQVAGTVQSNDFNPGSTSAVDFLGESIEVEDPYRHTKDLTVTGVVSVPLYQGGSVSSAVRQAKQVASQRRIQIIEASRAVREAVASSWGNLDAASEQIVSAKAQVEASQVALEGVQQEYLVGSRTTLDVLDQQQELTNAKIQLVIAERDRIVASFQLLASVGKLTARYLGLNVDYYDPTEYYREVRDKWLGLDAETVK